MENLKQYIEALIFTSEQSITANEIAAALKASFGWGFPMKISDRVFLN